MSKTTRQGGAVSLFLVIFTSLFIAIISVGFVQLMLRNQEAASNVNLSQSAYEAALAGVEDAKRALVAGGGSIANGDSCNSVKRALTGSDDMTETKIQQMTGSVSNSNFDQAYTCVKVSLETETIGADDLTQNESTVLSLSTNGQAFNTIQIDWSLPSSDSGATNPVPTFPSGSGNTLPLVSDWGAATPALMRAQLIQYSPNFTVTDFDSTDDASSRLARTKFLYPQRGAITVDPQDFVNDINGPTTAFCNNTKCSIRLEYIDGETRGNYANNVFLRLTPLYNSASNIRISAYSGTTPVRFVGSYAQVDSTGRAGNTLRRVNAQVDLRGASTFPYPEAALDLEGSLCKVFGVGDRDEDYQSGEECTPARQAD